MPAVAIEKIEYTPEGGSKAVVLLPGTPIPADFKAEDLAELTQWGAIGEPAALDAKRAIAEAERTQAIADAAAQAARDNVEAVRQMYASDSGGADEQVRPNG